MTAKSKRKPSARRLKAGLSEAVQFAKGELTLRTVQVPDPPAAIAAKAPSPPAPLPQPGEGSGVGASKSGFLNPEP